MYCAGLAVESMLRAYRWRRQLGFEVRHDLFRLFRESGLLGVDERGMRGRGVAEDQIQRYSLELLTAVNVVYALWSNNLRYASESRARAWLVSMGRYGTKRRDVLKTNALELLNAAQRIVDKGIFLWNSKKK
jgi:hypothetical protein